MRKNNLKVYTVGNANYNSSSWLFGESVDNVDDCDVVVFRGGSDINPEIYNHKKATATRGINDTRDEFEVSVYKKALKKGKIMFGICRGHQLLSSLNGAFLIQDVNEHYGTHNIFLENGKSIETNSIHHQQVYPYDLPSDKYQVLGWSLNQSEKFIDQTSSEFILKNGSYYKNQQLRMETEIIYFPETNCIGCQGHPEMKSPNSDLTTYCRELVVKLHNKLNKKNFEEIK